jgi:hypothetical protein
MKMNFNVFNNMNHKQLRNVVIGLLFLAVAASVLLFWRVGNAIPNEIILGTQNEQAAIEKITQIQNEWREKLSNKEAELERYRAMLDKRGEVTTIVQTKLIYKDTGSIKEVIVFVPIDPETGDSLKCFPTYIGSVKNKWLDLTVTASKDSIGYDLQTRDSILIVFKELKQGFWIRPKTEVFLYSQSPYSGDISQPINQVTVPKRPNLLQRLINRILNVKS